MDEVDGMTSDKNGITVLIGLIKKTKIPIICVANNRIHTKMRRLLKMCYDLKFESPKPRLIIDQLVNIARSENQQYIDRQAMAAIVLQQCRDVRACINTLQLLSRYR